MQPVSTGLKRYSVGHAKKRLLGDVFSSDLADKGEHAFVDGEGGAVDAQVSDSSGAADAGCGGA